MSRYTSIALVTLLMVPAALTSQETPEARVRSAMDRAAAAGVPVSLLEARVAEGRAKGIAMDRIAQAVERRADALVRARAAMEGARGLTEADLAAGGDAMEAGIEAGALRTVIEQARAEDRPVAIAVLTYLHREQGMPVDQALARVGEALGQGPDALRSLPARAAAARGRGGRPDGAGRGGPPSGVPAPGGRPGGGRPDGVGTRRPGGGGAPDGIGG